jgi:hypothetical protein
MNAGLLDSWIIVLEHVVQAFMEDQHRNLSVVHSGTHTHRISSCVGTRWCSARAGESIDRRPILTDRSQNPRTDFRTVSLDNA